MNGHRPLFPYGGSSATPLRSSYNLLKRDRGTNWRNKLALCVLIWMDRDDHPKPKIAGLPESVTADIWLGVALAGVNTLIVIGLYIVFK
jgi:hypothetical protein